jgi:hypothetical protein
LNSDALEQRPYFEKGAGTRPKSGRREGVDDWFDVAKSGFLKLSSRYGRDATIELTNVEQNVNAVIVQWQRIEQALRVLQATPDSAPIGREDVQSGEKLLAHEDDRLKVDLQFLLLSLSRLEKHLGRLLTISNDYALGLAVRPIAELLRKAERAERFLRQLDDFGGLAEAQVWVTETGRVQFHYNYGNPRADGADVITFGKSDVRLMTRVYNEIISYLR